MIITAFALRVHYSNKRRIMMRHLFDHSRAAFNRINTVRAKRETNCDTGTVEDELR